MEGYRHRVICFIWQSRFGRSHCRTDAGWCCCKEELIQQKWLKRRMHTFNSKVLFVLPVVSLNNRRIASFRCAFSTYFKDDFWPSPTWSLWFFFFLFVVPCFRSMRGLQWYKIQVFTYSTQSCHSFWSTKCFSGGGIRWPPPPAPGAEWSRVRTWLISINYSILINYEYITKLLRV